MAGLGRVLDKTLMLDPDRQHTVDTALAAEAPRRVLTPGELGRAANRRVLQADPEAATRRVARARRDRSVRLGDPVDGTAGLYAVLRAEEAVSIFTGLDRTARGMRAHGDDRSLDTLRADLLVEHLTGTPMTRLPDPTTAPAPARRRRVPPAVAPVPGCRTGLRPAPTTARRGTGSGAGRPGLGHLPHRTT